jgi:hypothetical protein
MSPAPVPLRDAAAALLARYPMTPERAASNARILEEEVAAYDEAHPETPDPAAGLPAAS